MRYIGMAPAYGRDYKSKAGVLQDFKEGKDFLITDFGPDAGRAANRESFDDVKTDLAFTIRYKGLRQVCVIVLKANGSCDFQKAGR